MRRLAKHWETCRLTLVNTFPDTLSEEVAKTNAITITCVKAVAPLKTDGDIDASFEAYTDVDTINEFERVALFHLKAYTFFSVQAKSVADTQKRYQRKRCRQ